MKHSFKNDQTILILKKKTTKNQKQKTKENRKHDPAKVKNFVKAVHHLPPRKARLSC